MKTIDAGEMYGFRVVNIFPEDSTDDEWADFADAIIRILDRNDGQKIASA
ncbi:MAG: hypothetical protein LBU86_07085 [Oscillospiraceae bacterium]|jgi:hypothetical protein|nr:hypothetical protein [Oscillospiraceae bacterium]